MYGFNCRWVAVQFPRALQKIYIKLQGQLGLYNPSTYYIMRNDRAMAILSLKKEI